MILFRLEREDLKSLVWRENSKCFVRETSSSDVFSIISSWRRLSLTRNVDTFSLFFCWIDFLDLKMQLLFWSAIQISFPKRRRLSISDIGRHLSICINFVNSRFSRSSSSYKKVVSLMAQTVWVTRKREMIAVWFFLFDSSCEKKARVLIYERRWRICKVCKNGLTTRLLNYISQNSLLNARLLSKSASRDSLRVSRIQKTSKQCLRQKFLVSSNRFVNGMEISVKVSVEVPVLRDEERLILLQFSWKSTMTENLRVI